MRAEGFRFKNCVRPLIPAKVFHTESGADAGKEGSVVPSVAAPICSDQSGGIATETSRRWILSPNELHDGPYALRRIESATTGFINICDFHHRGLWEFSPAADSHGHSFPPLICLFILSSKFCRMTSSTPRTRQPHVVRLVAARVALSALESRNHRHRQRPRCFPRLAPPSPDDGRQISLERFETVVSEGLTEPGSIPPRVGQSMRGCIVSKAKATVCGVLFDYGYGL